jgi:uncharacterized delta-60 repeat protein
MWFSRPARRQPATITRPRPAARLRLEPLEDRSQPSGGALDPTFGAGGVVATNLGSANDTALAVALQADGKLVTAGYSNGQIAVARYLPGGTIDAGFGSGGVVKTTVTNRYGQSAHAVAVQPDGKIVVVGGATVGQSHSQPYIYDNALVVARYNTNGSLDKTFNRTGYLLINPTSGDDGGAAVAIQPDGKIVVGGWTNHSAATGYPVVTGDDFFLARVTAAGGLDTTFGAGGMVATDFSPVRPAWRTGLVMDHASAVVVLPGGRILAAGDTLHGFALARYNPNGSLDTTYGTGGLARVGTDALVRGPGSADGQVEAVSAAVQPDGKVVLDGSLYRPSIDRAPYDLLVGRVDGAGNPDPTFGGTGLVTFDLGTDPTTGVGNDERAGGIGLQADGSVVVGGTRQFLDPVYGSEDGSDALLIRFTPAGALDPTFGAGGSVTTDVRGYESGTALVIQPDGKIVQVGSTDKTIQTGSEGDFLLARYLPAAPVIGSFTAGPAGAGTPVTLSASGITDGNANAAITQVAFYYFDAGGSKVTVGTSTQASGGAWSVTINLPPGTYTLFAQATDRYGVLGDPVALTLQIT